MNVTIKNATKFTNGDRTTYTAVLETEGPVRSCAIFADAEGKHIGVPPQQAYTDKDGNKKYANVVFADREALNAAAEAAVKDGTVRLMDNPVETSLGKKIGYATLAVPTVDVRVRVNVTKDGVPYMRLPGTNYTAKDENGNDVNKVSYFVYIPKEECDELAKQVVDTAVEAPAKDDSVAAE
jgi:hypothetical protein